MHLVLLASTANSIISDGIAPAITTLALLSSILCTLFIIIGGYQYITSSGHPERLIRAKKLIRNALIGLAIVLSAALLAHLMQNIYGPVASPPSKSVVPTLNPIKASSSGGIIGVIIKVIAGVLGSIIGTVATPFLKALSYFTSGTPLIATNHSVFDLWVSSVGIADALMVLVLIIIGIHTMGYLSLGIEEINIRHILPQVGFVFILINSSVFIIDAFIDLSNLLIRAIGGETAVNSVWQSLTNVLKQPSAYGLAALIIMTIFLVFSVILIIYYVGRIVTIYLGAVLAPLVILCWLIPSLRDMAISASKRYFSAIFVLFIHVVILELAASLLAGMIASSQNSSLDPLMSMVVGLATLIALLKTQGVMNQLSYATIGPRMTRQIAERLVLNASYIGSQASSFVGGFLPGHANPSIDSVRDYSLRQNNVINKNQNNNNPMPSQSKSVSKTEEDKKP